jgi:MFS transporter, FHS family, Na+ dependent glucose transporter 1
LHFCVLIDARSGHAIIAVSENMDTTTSIWRRVARASGAPGMSQTLTYYAAFVALGLTTASLGPTLLGLAQQTGSELAQISFLFTTRALGYLVGSFIGGRLYDRLPGHRTMAAALLAISLLLALVPTVPLLWLLTVVLLAVGFMEGVVDVGGNTLIVWVHRERVGPYMNGLHLFFALGAFLSPLIVAQAILRTGSLAWGYWMLALLLLPVAIRLVPLPSPAPILTREEQQATPINRLLLGLMLVFFLLVAGAENSFGGWIFTYSVKSGLADATTAAYINAAFWGAFTLSRLASIPIAARVRPRVIILADLVVALVGLAILLIFSDTTEALWLGTMLFGLGIASCFPTMLTFAGRHMTITGAITGWFFVGASAGGMIIPWLIGQRIEAVGPVVVLVIIGSALLLALIVFAAVLTYIRRLEVSKTR